MKQRIKNSLKTTKYGLKVLIAGLALLSVNFCLGVTAKESETDANSLTLVADGLPAATIVLSVKPTRAAQLAAYELQYHIRLITDATLPILTEGDEGIAGIRIAVGATEAASEAGLPPDGWQFLEYAIVVQSDTLILAGDDKDDFGKIKYNSKRGLVARESLPPIMDPQGTMHAVYMFLEDYCGVRWWNATEYGTEAPRTPTLTINANNIRRQPDFLYRDWGGGHTGWPNVFSQCFWNDRTPEFEAFLATAYPVAFDYHLKTDKPRDPEKKERGRLFFENHQLWFQIHQTEGIWLRRMRLGGSTRFSCNHSISSYYTRFGEKGSDPHPEWFAKGFKGKPNQLCYTQAGVVTQMVQDARDYFDGKLSSGMIKSFRAIPDSDYFPVVPNDGWGFCKCADCEALKHPDEKLNGHFANGWLSDYWFNFVNQVAREVKKTHPDRYIATLAYGEYAKMPSFTLEDNIAIQFCMGVRFPTDHVGQGHEWDILRNWTTRLPSQQVFLWLYYTFPREWAGDGSRWHCFPGFFMHNIGKMFKEYKALGCKGAFFNGWGEDINTYLTLKMLNDTKTSVDAVLDDFFTNYYGSAAEPMKALYLMMEDLFSNPDNYPPGKGGGQNADIAWGFLGNHERMQTMRTFLEDAKSATRTDIERKRIEIFEAGIFSYMEDGRKKYERSLGGLMERRYARVPWTDQEVEHGDPRNVNWSAAFSLVNWRQPYGEPTLYQPLLQMAHDDVNLYARYDEFMHDGMEQTAETLDSARLELVMTPSSKGLLHVISVAPDGGYETWQVDADGQKTPWEATFSVHSKIIPGESWVVEVAIPLQAIPVRPGDRMLFNAARREGQSDDVAVWQCTYGDIRKSDQLGFVHIDGSAERPVPPMDDATLVSLRKQDLVGWWQFDETSGDVALDSSGNGLNGTYLGMKSGKSRRGPGLYGTALYCKGGRSGGVTVENAAELCITNGPMSIEAWVKLHPNLLGNGYPNIVSKGSYGLHLRRNATRLWFHLKDLKGNAHLVNTQDFPREENNIAPYQWMYLVATWDGKTMQTYMNGRSHGKPTSFSGNLVPSDTPLKIGGSSPLLAIDEVAIYKRTFTPEEVQARFLAGCKQINNSKNVED